MKRQAEITRKMLLRAASQAVAEAGATTFTLEAVATRAGVSKGALLHHFPTKSVLVEEVVKDMVGQFWRSVQGLASQDPDGHCRMTRAYVMAVVGQTENQVRQWGGLTTAFMIDPSLMHLWRNTLRQYQSSMELETKECEAAWIAKLAADSIWSAELFGMFEITTTERVKLIERIVGLTRKNEKEQANENTSASSLGSLPATFNNDLTPDSELVPHLQSVAGAEHKEASVLRLHQEYNSAMLEEKAY